ncbi:hypothetical protein AALB39_06260 [Lachnospiraceae bacterium 54-53]
MAEIRRGGHNDTFPYGEPAKQQSRGSIASVGTDRGELPCGRIFLPAQCCPCVRG